MQSVTRSEIIRVLIKTSVQQIIRHIDQCDFYQVRNSYQNVTLQKSQFQKGQPQSAMLWACFPPLMNCSNQFYCFQNYLSIAAKKMFQPSYVKQSKHEAGNKEVSLCTGLLVTLFNLHCVPWVKNYQLIHLKMYISFNFELQQFPHILFLYVLTRNQVCW